MTAEALAEKLRHEPFVPFRLRLTDGRAVDITNPDTAFISHQALYVFMVSKRGEKIAEDSFLISLRHIASIEDLEAAAA
jgi:hypothetical protein